MHLWATSRYLTLVVVYFLITFLIGKGALAATDSPSPDFVDPPVEKTNVDPKNDPTKTELIQIHQPPPIQRTATEQEYYFPYSRAMSIRFAGLYDSAKFSDKGIIYLGGASLLFRPEINQYYDAGFDLMTNSTGNVHAERRWIFSRSRFRPYMKAGAGVNLVPDDQLATFLRLRNYQLRAAIGAEDLFLVPMSWRYEFELLVGTESVGAILSLGYSWAW